MHHAEELLAVLASMTLGDDTAPKAAYLRIQEEYRGAQNWSSTPGALGPALFNRWIEARDHLLASVPVVDWSSVPALPGGSRKILVLKLAEADRAAA